VNTNQPEFDNNRISNIAHFFLSDMDSHSNPKAEQVSHPYPPTPQRTDQPEMTDPSYFSEIKRDLSHGDSNVKLIGVICSHLRWHAVGSIREFAKSLVKADKKVGVLNLQSWNAQLNIYRKVDNKETERKSNKQEYLEESIRVLHSSKADGNGKADVLECLDKQAKSLDYLLLMYGPEFNGYFQVLVECVDSVCVITNTQREQIISSYQAIKDVSLRANNVSIGVFVSDADSSETAKGIYERLAKTAKEHLNIELSYFGCFVSETSVVSEMIARQQLRTDSAQSMEQWIENLRSWLENHKKSSDESFESEDNVNFEKSNHKSRKVQRARAQIKDNGRSTSSHCERRDLIKMSKLVGGDEQFLALHIGKKILGEDYKPVNSDLIDFLRVSGVICARLTNEDKNDSCFVLVFNANDSNALVDWALINYPHKTDKLMIISDAQLGAIETRLWETQFSEIQIVKMLQGQLNDEDVIIISL